MIVVDGAPLVWTPRSGVAQALRQLLHGWALPAAQVLEPAPGTSPRAWRKELAARASALGAEALYSPWSAFPDVAVPVVACIHELPFVRHGGLEGRVRALRHKRWLARNVEQCAALVVPSEATRDDLLTLHPDAEARVHVVPNGFDDAPWRDAQPATRPQPYAVMVGLGAGRFGARKKGLDVAREAWAAGPIEGCELVVVDGALDHDALRALVAGAHVLVYPSRSEGFGYPPLEAMAAGVPVVAADAGSIPEVVGDAALLVPAGSSAALREAVARVRTDDALRERLVAAGAVRAGRFPPAETARALQAVFARLGVTA